MRNDFCSNYLAHSAKGTEWQNHRYIKKVILSNGKPYYFYSMEAYQAYLKTLSGEKKKEKNLEGQMARKEPFKEIKEGLPFDRNINDLIPKVKSGKEAVKLILARGLKYIKDPSKSYIIKPVVRYAANKIHEDRYKKDSEYKNTYDNMAYIDRIIERKKKGKGK